MKIKELCGIKFSNLIRIGKVVEDELNGKYAVNPKRNSSNQPISLQTAIVKTFNKFLDNSLTINHRKYDLDLNLNT